MAYTSVVSPAVRRAPFPKMLAGAMAVIVVVGILGITGVLAQARQFIPGLRQAAPSYQTTTVSRGNIGVSVVATGPVAAVEELPLTFKTSGKISELKVQVGDQVQKGQVLATLDTTDLKTSLDQAKASLAQVQANLAKLEAGATSAQKGVAQASVDSARKAATDAQASVASTKAGSATDVAAAQSSVGAARTVLQGAQAALASAKDQETKGLAADQTAVNDDQKNLAAVTAAVAANGPVLQQQVEKAKDDLWSAQTSRDGICGRSKGADCAAANANVASAETGVNTAQAQLDQGQKQGQQQIAQAEAQLAQAKSQLANDKAKFDAAVVSAQNQVKQAQASVSSSETGVAQAQSKAAADIQGAQAQASQANSALKTAQANYNQTVAPATPADIDAAKAQVANAQAAVAQAQANLDATTLTAPFDGTVAAINGTVGQWVSGGPVNSTQNALFTLVSLNDLQVTAQVNEADIGKVKVGDPVSFTVSAYPNETFAGKVLSIQPVGTVVQNVVNYNVTCSIEPTKDATLYPGMTAAATIVSEQHNGVLLVPNSALSFAQSASRNGLVQTANGRQSNLQSSARQAGQRPRAQPTAQTGAKSNSAAGSSRSSNSNPGVVLTLKNGQLVPVPLTLGISDGTNTEVLSGLQAGESIVVGTANGTASSTSNQTSGPRSGGNPLGGGFRG